MLAGCLLATLLDIPQHCAQGLGLGVVPIQSGQAFGGGLRGIPGGDLFGALSFEFTGPRATHRRDQGAPPDPLQSGDVLGLGSVSRGGLITFTSCALDLLAKRSEDAGQPVHLTGISQGLIEAGSGRHRDGHRSWMPRSRTGFRDRTRICAIAWADGASKGSSG